MLLFTASVVPYHRSLRCAGTTGWRKGHLPFHMYNTKCQVTSAPPYILRSYYILQLNSSHVSSCDVNACSWDVRGDLTLNSMAQIHTSVTAYVMWSRVELWSAHVPVRLSNFCCLTHFVRRDVRVERSSDVISCFQKWRKCLWKKYANGPFYMTPSHQIIEISIWEPTHGKG